MTSILNYVQFKLFITILWVELTCRATLSAFEICIDSDISILRDHIWYDALHIMHDVQKVWRWGLY